MTTSLQTSLRKFMLRPRRLMLLTHLVGFGLLLGGSVATTLLGLAGEAADGAHRVFALGLAAQLQDVVLRPGFWLAAVSGLALGLGMPDGLVRYRWMVAKQVVTAILFFHSQVEYRPLTHQLLQVAETASHGTGLPATWAQEHFHLTRVGVIQITVALVLAALGIFKPGGKMRWRRAAARPELP